MTTPGTVQRVYTEDDITTALTTLQANGGQITRTAEQLGIPRPTLTTWRDGKNRVPATEAAQALRNSQLTRKQSALARKWQRVVDLSLKRAEELLRGESKVQLRDLSWTAGVGTDKVQLLTGKPTERTELSLAAFLARESIAPDHQP